MNVNERIQEIIRKLFNGNKSAFSKRIEIKPTTLSNITRKEKPANPSSDILERIIKNIPEINAYWLVIGEGEMLKQNSENNNRNVHNEGSISGSVSTGDNHTSINGGVSVGNDSTSKLSDYEQRILLLEEKVLHLEEMLKEKERFIQVLLKNS